MNTPPETPETPKIPETPETPETPAENTNILDEVEYILYQANGWKRFANYLVDWMSFYILWRLLLINWWVRLLLFLKFPLDNPAFDYFIAFVSIYTIFGLIVGGVEAATGGKTLGKYITATRAVNNNGSRITPKTAFLRYLVRLVPFEAFSALGSPSYPWHDRWTKTIVIDERQTTLPPQE